MEESILEVVEATKRDLEEIGFFSSNLYPFEIYLEAQVLHVNGNPILISEVAANSKEKLSEQSRQNIQTILDNSDLTQEMKNEIVLFMNDYSHKEVKTRLVTMRDVMKSLLSSYTNKAKSVDEMAILMEILPQIRKDETLVIVDKETRDFLLDKVVEDDKLFDHVKAQLLAALRYKRGERPDDEDKED